jgi:hypothetical protein
MSEEPLDGVEQHLVDEAHDRRFVDLGIVVLFAALVTGADFEILERGVVEVAERGELVILGVDVGIDALAEFLLLDQHRLGGDAGVKGDLVERTQVGRVRQRDVEPVAAAVEWQHMVAADQLDIDQPLRMHGGVEGVEIEQRRAELLGGRHRDVEAAGQLALHQVRHQRHILLTRLAERLDGHLFAQQPILDQTAREAGQFDRGE